MPWSFFECWVLSQFFHSSLSLSRGFSSSSLSAIRVLSSGYLRLLIFLLAIWIPAWASSNLAFSMMYAVYKLNKQGDNIQPWCTPFPIRNQSIVPCPVLTVASWPAYRFLSRQVRWSCIPISLKIFQFVVIHTVKGFFHSQWNRSRCFSGILLLFLLPNGCWQFDFLFLCLSKSSWNIWTIKLIFS